MSMQILAEGAAQPAGVDPRHPAGQTRRLARHDDRSVRAGHPAGAGFAGRPRPALNSVSVNGEAASPLAPIYKFDPGWRAHDDPDALLGDPGRQRLLGGLQDEDRLRDRGCAARATTFRRHHAAGVSRRR
jgi:hypothetical protein